MSNLANIPAGSPPLGVIPNFVDPVSRADKIIALHVIFLVLMIIAVTLRIVVKSRIVRQVEWDDYTCCIAALASITCSATTLNSLRFGFGRHIWDVRATTLADINHARQDTANGVAYPLVAAFVKLSLLLLYHRLFWVDHLQRRGFYIGLVALAVFYVPYLGAQIYGSRTCISVASAVDDNYCKNAYWTAIAGGIVNVLTDFYVLLLPIPCLAVLRIPLRRKIGLYCVFSVGFAACLISVARLIAIIKTLKLADFTWNMALISELSAAEVNIAIICSCMTSAPAQ